MNALSFVITLQEPVLAAYPNAGEPNSAVTHGYIPGSMIRGAMVRAMLQKYPGIDVAADPEKRKLFFEEHVFFLNAYPVAPGSLTRMLPRPLSWFVEKDAPEDVVSNLLWVADNKLKKPKRISKEFFTPAGPKHGLYSAKRQMNVHNASDDRNQKKSGTSQVYRYEALASGERFSGLIVSEDVALLNELKAALGDTLFLGGSRTGGYGACEISQIVVDEKEWVGEYAPGKPSTEGLEITLLSDAIVPPGYSNIFDGLAALFGLTGGAAAFKVCFYDTRLVGGFNRQWGLPLPLEWSVRAGSTFLVDTNALTAQRQTELVEKGIGLRRQEGFGRVAFNLHTAPLLKCQEATMGNQLAQVILSDQEKLIAALMAKRMSRQRLEQKLVTEITRFDESAFRNMPSRTQLNRARTVVRQALLEKDLQIVSDHFSGLASAKKQWEQARLNGQPLLGWIVQTVDLGPCKVAGVQPDMGDLLVEYNLRLIDGVFKKAVELVRDDARKGGVA